MTSRERAEQVARDYGTEQGGWLTTRLAREFDEATQAAAAQMRERCAYLVLVYESDELGEMVNQHDKARAFRLLGGISKAIRALPLTEEVTR